MNFRWKESQRRLLKLSRLFCHSGEWRNFARFLSLPTSQVPESLSPSQAPAWEGKHCALQTWEAHTKYMTKQESTLSLSHMVSKLAVTWSQLLWTVPASSFVGVYGKKDGRGPPRAPGASSRLHYYKKIEGKSGRGRPPLNFVKPLKPMPSLEAMASFSLLQHTNFFFRGSVKSFHHPLPKLPNPYLPSSRLGRESTEHWKHEKHTHKIYDQEGIYFVASTIFDAGGDSSGLSIDWWIEKRKCLNTIENEAELPRNCVPKRELGNKRRKVPAGLFDGWITVIVN